MRKLISVVVPVYNEQDNIEVFSSAVKDALQPLDYDYELIFVDDGSSDASAYILQNLTAHDNHIKFIMLSRNFGHQTALTCGLDHAEGDAVITMDGDMQHPPAMLPDMIKDWEEGFELIQTVRLSTEDAGFFKRVTSKVYYKIINMLAQVPVVEGGSDFRLMDKKVVQAFRLYRERGRFIRGLVGMLGFKHKQVEFIAPARFAGVSKFSLRKMLHFALDGVTSLSTVPLRISFYCGILLGFASIVMTGHVLYIKIFTDEAVAGWSTLAASTFFIGGMQLMGIGVLGEYIARVFLEVKQRPLYIIGKKIKNGKEF